MSWSDLNVKMSKAERRPAWQRDDEPNDPFNLLDVGGYLACGCHGTQCDHTCEPLDHPDQQP